MEDAPQESSGVSQAFLDLQQRVVDLEHREHSLVDELRESRRISSEWEAKHRFQCEQLEEMQKRLAEKPVGGDDMSRQIAALKQDNSRLLEIRAKQEAEIDRLIAQANEQSDRLAEALARSHKLEVDVQQAETKNIPLQFQNTKLSQEIELLNRHVKFLEAELEGKRDSLLKSQQESAERVNSLNRLLSDARQEVAQVRSEAESTQTRAEDAMKHLQSQVDALREDIALKELTATRAKTSLATETALTAALRRARDELQERVTSLTQALDKAGRETALVVGERDRLTQELAVAKTELADAAKTITSLQNETRLARNVNADLTTEVDRLKDLLETGGVGKNVPTVESTAVPAGLTVLEAYSKYIAATQELRSVQKELRTLEAYRRQTQRELEEKAPLLSEQRQQYQRLAQSHAALTLKLQEMTERFEALQAEADELRAGRETAARQAALAKLEGQDLARQVRHLLKRTATGASTSGGAGGAVGDDGSMSMSMSSPVTDRYSRRSMAGMMTPTGGSHVESSTGSTGADLVVFSSIDELQAKNQELLAMNRELSSVNEALGTDRAARDAVIKDLTDKVERSKQLTRLVEDMRLQRVQLEAKVETLIAANKFGKQLAGATKSPNKRPQNPDEEEEEDAQSSSTSSSSSSSPTEGSNNNAMADTASSSSSSSSSDAAAATATAAAAEARAAQLENELKLTQVKVSDVSMNEYDSEENTSQKKNRNCIY